MGIDLKQAFQDATSLFSSPQQQTETDVEYDYEELPQDVEYYEEYGEYEDEPSATPAPVPAPASKKTGKKTGSAHKPSTSRRPGGRSAIPSVRWEAWALLWAGCYVAITLPLPEFFHLVIRWITSMPVVAIAAVGFYVFHRLWDRSLNERGMNEFLLAYLTYAALAFVAHKS